MALPLCIFHTQDCTLLPVQRMVRVTDLHQRSVMMGSMLKSSLAGPEAVLAYLSRYTHRVAISNRRLIAADASTVTFKYKDYRVDGAERFKTMTLETDEFIRRSLMHVLPKGFHRMGCLPMAGALRILPRRANCSLYL